MKTSAFQQKLDKIDMSKENQLEKLEAAKAA